MYLCIPMHLYAIISLMLAAALNSGRHDGESLSAALAEPGRDTLATALSEPSRDTLATAVSEPCRDTLATAIVAGHRDRGLVSSSPLLELGGEKLRREGASSLDESLRRLPGVQVIDYGGLGGMKTVSIRNFGSQHTAVVYNGVVLSDMQNGMVDIGSFGLEEVEKLSVEIAGDEDIFKPARLFSSVGTVSVTSQKPWAGLNAGGSRFIDRSSIKARMRLGSFNTYAPYISASYSFSPRWAARLNAEYCSSAGNYPYILENGNELVEARRVGADFRKLKSEADLSGQVGTNGALDMNLSYASSERGLPGNVVYYSSKGTERLWERDIRANAVYSFDNREWKSRAIVAYRGLWNRHVDSNPAYVQPVDDLYWQQEAQICGMALKSWTTGRRGNKLELSLSEDIVAGWLDSNLASCIFPFRVSSHTALSLKYTGGACTVVGSLLGVAMGEFSRAAHNTEQYSEPIFRGRISPSLSFSYILPLRPILGEGRMRASIKESHRMPNFNELYYPRSGNRELRPETAWQSNLGLTWTRSWGNSGASSSASSRAGCCAGNGAGVEARSGAGKSHSVAFTIDGYFNMVKDKIVAVPSMFIWNMRNLGRVMMTGCDLHVNYSGNLAYWLSLHSDASYSYQYCVDISSPEAKNYRHQIPYVPRYCGSASLSLVFPWFSLAYTLTSSGERYSLAQNTKAYRLSPYADHSLTLTTHISPKKSRWYLDLSLQALNLAGTNYQIIQYYPMPGRHYRLSITFAI